MNERIKELLAQSGGKAYYDGVAVDFRNGAFQKFVELVVKECAMMADPRCGSVILENFGVADES